MGRAVNSVPIRARKLVMQAGSYAPNIIFRSIGTRANPMIEGIARLLVIKMRGERDGNQCHRRETRRISNLLGCPKSIQVKEQPSETHQISLQKTAPLPASINRFVTACQTNLRMGFPLHGRYMKPFRMR